ncbi:Putative ABC transporter ATP-binding protein [Vibrio nigripulchritudo SFn27]|uniref:Putative ABC transporter ATP-binding protein n=1 Tax=Vibrio nigripulchritudo TaxID=28173 RepID=U4KFN2_9VIBR|nr:ABC transporter ATP-binding protein [Vibrio nigripulchritudo]CCN81682.1 Putative ABC transporter ATP-binding protein [Vibrio nigripulchritudo BLFn1]CCN91535.1 Putative ABC transporter ATP-binding protein [Vibrio nigripulchritudo SFn27]CCN95676.1 Putative ABC transporter ATP-binding protein [Vibrio nigripulchritudo ENn2]CCO39485.1 Putative ABC transporter ATP-binding protein [Vibrio nigripulchritudo SFn135]CCO51171.1 Putative ABC transporter ATP-binding protein [Vibrio nigripulchritudo Wn13]
MLKVDNVTKKFNVTKSPLKRIAYNLGLKSFTQEADFFYALKNVSFSLEKGETVGILGKNGAGKSTLLQIVCGTLKSTKGRVERPKKVAALLELGAGFNPEFSGIENIYLNGALIGMKKEEIKTSLESIVDFSELGEFIHKPVKTYSSGMFARLAFSVAVHSKPDLLIVDEALSVGDMAFQEKSINKMKELRNKGIPIFFVSHSLPMIRNFCTRAIWMEKGQIKLDSDAKTVCKLYAEDSIDKSFSVNGSHTSPIRLTPDNPKIYIKSVDVSDTIINTGQDLCITIKTEKRDAISGKLGVGIIIKNENDVNVSVISTIRDSLELSEIPGSLRCFVKSMPLMNGTYTISVSITDELATFHYDRIDYANHFIVETRENNIGLLEFEGTHGLSHSWEKA